MWWLRGKMNCTALVKSWELYINGYDLKLSRLHLLHHHNTMTSGERELKVSDIEGLQPPCITAVTLVLQGGPHTFSTLRMRGSLHIHYVLASIPGRLFKRPGIEAITWRALQHDVRAVSALQHDVLALKSCCKARQRHNNTYVTNRLPYGLGSRLSHGRLICIRGFWSSHRLTTDKTRKKAVP